MRFLRTIAILLTVSAVCLPSHHRHNRPRSGQAGAFDYYMLVLSWSPEFCYSHPSAAQCSKHTGFIVHGLWPQRNDGSYPLNCQTTQPPPTDPGAMAGIMPQEIIEHEWQQHGTCSGLSGDEYFALIRKLYKSLTIPGQLRAPSGSSIVSAKELKQLFERSNPGWNDADIAIQRRGNYLSAVNVCESKSASPAPVACSGIPDANGGTFIVPPVR